MQTSIIIQARTGSTRLPNKMLKAFYQEKCILQILLERIKSEFPLGFNQIIVATTSNARDNKIAELCESLNVRCYRGDENDVLQRFIDCAQCFGVDKIIRVCADNVFLDMANLHELYDALGLSECDYLSYCTSNGTPSIKTHYGFWAEGTTLKTLKSIAAATDDKVYHEHVTNYIYTNPDNYSIVLRNIESLLPGIEKHDDIRLTIDTEDDFRMSQEIYSYFVENSIDMTSKNIVEHVAAHPNYLRAMKNIIQQNTK